MAPTTSGPASPRERPLIAGEFEMHEHGHQRGQRNCQPYEIGNFGVPLEIHYNDGSLNLAADGPVQEYE